MRKHLFLLLSLTTAAAANAATISVNSLTDTTADDGVCTLREAITAADTNSASGAMPGECTAGADPDVIVFAAPLDGTITLGSTLTVTSSLEIDGPADRSINIVSGAFQALLIDDSAPGTTQEVALRRLTFTGGTFGITYAENLVVDSCTITGFTVTGMDAILGGDGALLLSNSTLSGNDDGGAFAVLVAFGPTTVIHSTITDNTGDGLLAAISLHIINSVVAGNSGDDCFSTTPDLAVGNFFGDTTCDGVADGDPMLLGLADNGGPTLTHGLDLASPLRDAGDDAGCLAKDQRGQDRAKDGDGDTVEKCDVGAVEVEDDTTTPVSLLGFQIE